MSCSGLLEEEAFWVLVRMWYILIVEILSKPYIVYGYLIVFFNITNLAAISYIASWPRDT